MRAFPSVQIYTLSVIAQLVKGAAIQLIFPHEKGYNIEPLYSRQHSFAFVATARAGLLAYIVEKKSSEPSTP